ncbi:DUF6339 family protein [Streptomyces sp. NPDC127110]|uniref:DUF6339 family protein n=1 Tax=Streptomyces sp. NPDC127110 TaxID=3345362 RepID=UPI00362CF70C
MGMSIRFAPGAVPEYVGLLAEVALAPHLGADVLSGRAVPPPAALCKASVYPNPERRRRTGPVRVLVEEAMRRFAENPPEADGWLAPRLHATLRMTRAEAADPRLWNFLAALVAPDYVGWRHGGTGTIAAARFVGPHYTQVFARLWWAAELFRNGEDYRPVEVACRVQDVLNTTMRLDVIDHRPTARTMTLMLERRLAAQPGGAGDWVNAFSAAVNSAGSTLVYDVLAPAPPHDGALLSDWIAEAEDEPVVPWDRLPSGPDDGEVPEETVQVLLPLFERLAKEAPARKRGPKEA